MACHQVCCAVCMCSLLFICGLKWGLMEGHSSSLTCINNIVGTDLGPKLSPQKIRREPGTDAWQQCNWTVSLIPRPFPKLKRERGWYSGWHFLSHGVGPYVIKNCIFKSSTRVSDASLHMDYYTGPLTTAWDGSKIYWDNWRQAVKQVFTTTKSVQNGIACADCWLVISKLRSALPHVTRTVASMHAQNTFARAEGQAMKTIRQLAVVVTCCRHATLQEFKG